MAAKGRFDDDWDDQAGDGFLDDGAYDRYYGPDLSDDPMLADEKKGRKKPSRKDRLELSLRQAEKEALKAEIIAELKAGEAERKKRSSRAAGQAAEAEEAETGQEQEADGPRRPSRFTAYLISFLSGNILSRQEVRRAYPYLLFIALLAFFYIGNVFRMQHLYRKHESLTVEVRELRAKSMTIASEKMRATRQSNIIREIEKRGLPLKESLAPNKTIQR